MRRAAALCALFAVIPVTAAGQETRNARPWPTPGRLQARVVFSDVRLDLEPAHVSGSDLPRDTSEADFQTDYDVRHTTARLEAAYAIGVTDELQLELYGGLGWGWTAITWEYDAPDADVTAESEGDFTLGVGGAARFFLSESFFAAAGYGLTYSNVTFEDQSFWRGAVVDARQDVVLHEVTATLGLSTDIASVWGGLGVIFYWGDLNIDEKPATGTARWDATFDQGDSRLKGVIGAGLHPSEFLSCSLQFEFVPDPTVRIMIAWTF